MPAFLILVPFFFILPPSPFPPKTNLIPSWPGRETEAMRLEVEGRHTAERGQERAPMAPPQRPARGGAGTNSSSIPGTQHPCFCSYHITRTHTHADSPGMLSKQHEIHCCNVCCFFFFLPPTLCSPEIGEEPKHSARWYLCRAVKRSEEPRQSG